MAGSSPTPLWLALATGAALAATWLTEPDKAPQPKGSGNTIGADPNLDRLTGQVIELLGSQGIPAGRLKCMAPCPQVGSWADEATGRQAERVAERVLMSTGYKPQLVKHNNEWVINIVRGRIPPSIDRPLA
jgi:hypothetical protein